MGRFFLSMLIGAVVMLATTDDSRDGLKETVRTLALTVAEAAQR